MAKKAAKKAARKVARVAGGGTAGELFLAAVLAEGNPSRLSEVSRAWFSEAEVAAYDFVRRYVSRHRETPAPETLDREGLGAFAPPPEPAAYHYGRLRDRHIFQLINERHPDLRAAMEARSGDNAIAALRAMLTAAGSVVRSEEFSTMAAEMGGVMEEFEAARESDGALTGIPFGRSTLDEITLGAQPGELAVVVGRLGLGKSFEILSWANAANLAGHSVGIISMEMGKRPLARRWLSIRTGINPKRIRGGEVSMHGVRRLSEHADEICSDAHPPVVLMAGNFRKDTGAVRRMFEQHDPAIIYIDAAYLMRPEEEMGRNAPKHERIGKMVSEVKELALGWGRPVGASVQFNRNQKDRGTSRPDSGDIGGSDSIGQDADLVVGGQLGPSPDEETCRKWTVMKYREGMKADYLTNFRFEPVDFSEVAEERPPSDMAWMEGGG